MNSSLKQSFRSIFAVWMRNVTVYKRTWLMNLLPNFFEPFLYLLGMGVGLGYYLNDGMEKQSYIAFIGPGLVASSAMNGAVFETTYNIFVRMNFNRLYNAYLATPTSVKDIVYGELLWATTRSVIYGFTFFLILFVFNALGHRVITSYWALLVPFALVLCGALFSVIGTAFTSVIKDINLYSYFFTLFVTPMFLFSGIFYPVSRFPYGETIAWFTPLYHCVRLMRALMQSAITESTLVSVAWLIFVTLVLLRFIPRKIAKKLIE